MSDLADVIQNAQKMNQEQDRPHVCKYCGKGFVRESTLTSHVCEKKRRWQQQNEQGVQMGFQAYLKFCQMMKQSKKQDYGSFADSPYYKAFVKFGRHMVSIRAIAPRKFTEYVLKNNIKLDHWCQDRHYDRFLNDYLRREPMEDAIARSIETMQRWAEEKEKSFHHYFRLASEPRVTRDIADGRISPWALYSSSTGIKWLENASEDSLGLIYDKIDPDYWHRYMTRHAADKRFARELTEEAGF